jgi:hypothetical protein
MIYSTITHPQKENQHCIPPDSFSAADTTRPGAFFAARRIPPVTSVLRGSLTTSVGASSLREALSGSCITGEVWKASRAATEGVVGDVKSVMLLWTFEDAVTVTVLT